MTTKQAIEAYDMALQPEEWHIVQITFKNGSFTRMQVPGTSDEVIDWFLRPDAEGRLKGLSYVGTSVESLTILD